MGMISRLIAKDSGSVDFEGPDIESWKSRDLSRRLAILTQHNNIQMKLTVEKLVAFRRFPYSAGHLTAEDHEMIERTISYFSEGKNAITGMVTSGSFNVLGNDGRCSLIGRELGFENIGTDAAIGTNGAQLAQEIMENELVMGTDAFKNGNIVYLEHPAVWYTAESSIQALNLMLQDLENALMK